MTETGASARKAAITTLGCKINQFESAAMIEKLTAAGYEIVSFTEQADVYIINTCTVTARTDAESRRLIRRAKRRNPAAKVVVTGCYAQVATEELEAMENVSLILGNTEKRRIETFLDDMDRIGKTAVSDIFDVKKAEPLTLQSFHEHTRAFIQIQNGCNEFCAYCIVPYARGKSRSVPGRDVLEGIQSLTRAGFREIVLTGIHLGAYGLDLENDLSLVDILHSVEKQHLAGRLRLGSIEPQEVTGTLIETMARSRTICPHLHIPLQSGSDMVLARMNRHYDGGYVRNLVSKLVSASPDICIGFDVIAGFPGETDEEFEETLSLLESLPFGYLHVFPFSRRNGTPAATMSGQVPAAKVTMRAKTLRELSDRKKRKFHEGYLDRELPVLFLTEGSSGVNGISRNYLQVRVPEAAGLVNTEGIVRITGLADGILTGVLVTA